MVGTRALDEIQTREVLANPAMRDVFGARLGQMLVEHERIEFPSFPYEWAAEMISVAGMLTLDLAQALLSNGLANKRYGLRLDQILTTRRDGSDSDFSLSAPKATRLLSVSCQRPA